MTDHPAPDPPPEPSAAVRHRRWAGTIAVALLGLVLAAGVTVAASRLVSQPIGLAAQPSDLGAELAPPARTTTTTSTRTTRAVRTVTTTVPVLVPVPQPPTTSTGSTSRDDATPADDGATVPEKSGSGDSGGSDGGGDHHDD